MLMNREDVRLIRAGTKTLIRRRVEADKDCRYRAGQRVPLEQPIADPDLTQAERDRVRHGAPKPREEIEQLDVIAVTRQLLGDITEEQARAEGHKTLTSLRSEWVRRHDWQWHRAHKDRADAGDDIDLSPAALVARFLARWADVETWAIEVRLVAEARPRLLSARAGRDYTSRPHEALRDEPEAVDEPTQARISRDASVRDAEVRRKRLAEARAHIDAGVRILRGEGSKAKRAADSIEHYAGQVIDEQDEAA